jgi:hypothetical protein
LLKLLLPLILPLSLSPRNTRSRDGRGELMGMEQPPRHRPDLVKAPNSNLCTSGVDGTGGDKQSKMDVDFLG